MNLRGGRTRACESFAGPTFCLIASPLQDLRDRASDFKLVWHTE